MRCTNCGAGLRPDDRFCTQCAAPIPAPGGARSTPVVWAVVVAVVLLVTAGGATWYVLHGRTGTTTSAASGTSTATAAASAEAFPEALPRPVQSPAPARSSAPSDPTAALAAQADADRPTADAAVGLWLPQISSKFAGLEVGGVTYDDAQILAEFQDARNRYGAILVRSGDYSTFARAGLWVVLVPQPSAEPDAANAWCDSQRFGPDDCYAKRLSHTEGPSGNTKHRS